MSGFGGAVKLTGESEYKKALKTITQSLKEVGSEMKVVTSQFGKNDTSVKALTAKQEVLNTKLKEQTSKLNLIQTEYKNLSSRYEENTKKHNELVASYDKEKAELERIGKELGTSSKEYQEQKAKVEALEGEVKKSTTAQEANEKAMSDMRVEMNKAQSDVNKTTGELDKLETQLKESQAAESKAATETEKLGKAIADQEADVSKLKEEYKDAVLQFGKNSSEAQKLAGDIQKLSGELAENKKKMSDADSAADDLDKSLKDVGDSTGKAGGGFTVLKGALADLASVGIQKIAEGLKNVASASMEAWQQYDDGADIIIAKTGATGEAAEGLEDVYKTVSQNVVGSFDEIGTAVGEVNTRFGLTGTDLESLSEQFLKFAKLNDVDVNTAIDNTQSAMAAWGIEAKDAGLMLDTLNKAGQNTGVAVDKLGELMVTNAPALQSMGFSASDAAMFLANLEKSGVDASSTMTGLKKALTNAAKEGKPMSQAMDEMESSIKNASSETEAITIASELFGTKAGASIATAVRSGKLSFADLGTSMSDFEGNVNTTFEDTQDAPDKFALAIQGIKTRMAEMTGDLMEKYAPQIQAVLDAIPPVLNRILSTIGKVFGFIVEHSTGVKVALGALLGAFMAFQALKFANTIQTLIGGMQALELATIKETAATIANKAAQVASSAATKAAAAAQWLLNAAMSANPIGLVIAAVLALVAAFVVLWKKSETFREFWIGLWEKIKEVAGTVWEAITGFFSAAWEKIKEIWSVCKEFFSGVWNGIRSVFLGVIKFYSTIFSGAFNIVKNIWNKAAGFFSGIWSGIRRVFSGVGKWFTQIFQGAWRGIMNVFSGVGRFFGGIWNTIKEKFTNIGQKLGESIGGAFKKAINAVLRTVENVVNAPIRAINSLIGLINSLGLNLGYINEFDLPRLSKGGVLKRGQVGILEGDGAEAVVPLEQNTQWIRRVADEMKMEMVKGNQSILDDYRNISNEEITINVYASQGMDVNAVAVAVEQRLARVQKQRQEVWT